MTTRFHAWQGASLRTHATGVRPDGRLQGTQPLKVCDLNNPEDEREGAAPFQILGPGDVVGLAAGVISRRYPQPGAVDAEESKAVLVEFCGDHIDLPWRYAPQLNSTQLRPWIALVVGARGEVHPTGDGEVLITKAVQARHVLDQSWGWAHVHEVGPTTVARITCPADLAPHTMYVAALVPAYCIDGNGTCIDAWNGSDDVRLPCFDCWSFSTGEDGDFPQLASKLKAITPDSLGPSFGFATVRYDERSGERSTTLSVTGALQRSGQAAPEPLAQWIAADVSNLIKPSGPDERPWTLRPPRYPKSFEMPQAPEGDGWKLQLDRDPRQRGVAGLGLWAGIAWQDRIATAAATKAGDLQTACDRIAHLGLGLEASRSLWRRHVPKDPVERLAILGPVLGRLPATGNETVLSVISGRTPTLPRAMWSSAARRVFRSGPARIALAAPGANRFDQVLRAAATCPVPVRDPDAVPLVRPHQEDRPQPLGAGWLARWRQGPTIAAALLRRRRGAAQGNHQLPVAEAARRHVLVQGGSDGVQVGQHGHGVTRDVDWDALKAITGALKELRREPGRCTPVGVEALGKCVAEAIDPTVERPLVVDRVLGTLPGISHLGPIEIEPELDLPLWSFLAEQSPEWLLPGIGTMEMHRVMALETNPAFVEAMLVGANVQAVSELRWRNLPIRPRWSPMRKFWQRKNGEMDVEPIRDWPDGSALGGPGLQPGGLGAEAVVLFRTPLFRRYPATVVYLYPADPDFTPPADNDPMAGRKEFPTFTGRIGTDVVFFGFKVKPEVLKDHWVVLEEPPSGYRFYTEKVEDGTAVGPPQGNAAEHAYRIFATPVRVMIGRLLESP
ncbi:MAG: hypothetical protein NW204_09490 [Xanthomonadaceae bacterium]|nr:hypothetical protein [Xanthomonadaceae bacterium]